MKNFKILRDCRRRGDGLHHAVQAVAHMHDLALAHDQRNAVTKRPLATTTQLRSGRRRT